MVRTAALMSTGPRSLILCLLLGSWPGLWAAVPGFEGWEASVRGDWGLCRRGVLAQLVETTGCRFLAPPSAWTDYTFEFRARKTGGREGFMAFVRTSGPGDFYWWNIGGWGNTRHAIEKSVGGNRSVVTGVPGRVAAGVWHRIRLEVRGNRLRCSLNGRLIHDFQDTGVPLAKGTVGFGTWNTTAEFAGVRVTDLNTGAVLFSGADAEEPSHGRELAFEALSLAGWRQAAGEWAVTDGLVRQTSLEPNCLLLSPPLDVPDYVFEVEGRKTGGEEGFLVLFRVSSDSDFYWWNVAGWRNREHGIERKGSHGATVLARVAGNVEPGRWYRLRVAVQGDLIRCWLDGELIQEAWDATFADGGVGLGTWRTQAEFANPRVAFPVPPGDVKPETFYRKGADFAATLCGTSSCLRAGGGLFEAGPWRVSPSLSPSGEPSGVRAVHGRTDVVADAKRADGTAFWRVPEAPNGRLTVSGRGEGEATRLFREVTSSVSLRVRLQVSCAAPVSVWLNGYKAARIQTGRRGASGSGPELLLNEARNVLLALCEHGVGETPFSAEPVVVCPAVLRLLERDYPDEVRLLIRQLGSRAALIDWVHRPDERVRDVALRFARSMACGDPPREHAEGMLAAGEAADSPEWVRTLVRAHGALEARQRQACPPIAFVSRSPNSLRGTNGTMFARRTPAGSAIHVLASSRPGHGGEAVFRTGEGFIFDIHPGFDGKRLLMSYKAAVAEPFHIWEIGVDGTGLRQVTGGPCHDFNPVYLPDGRIAFSSSRVEAYSMCQNFLACALYTCDPDGTDVRRIDFTTLCTNAPALMPDGSLIATRWEYQDKSIFSWQGLWSVLPNGRNLKLYYGNTITVPNSLFGAKPVPGASSRVVITMAAHHHPPVGDIAIVDRRLGVENPAGMRQITFATQYRVAKGEHFKHMNWHSGDRHYPYAYTDPWPVSEDLILVSYGGADEDTGQFRICSLTGDGVRTPLAEEQGLSFFCPVSLGRRDRPCTVPGRAPTADGEGTFYVTDVYRGLEEQGVRRGQVAALRVTEVLPKKYNTEGPRYRDHYPVIGHGSYYVKRILGSVRVREDGSACFRAPANRELYFIALDGVGREVQRMGSVTQLTTGETSACIGCHENRLSAPPAGVAGSRVPPKPVAISAPAWAAGEPATMDFVRFVQPVLDRYCARCHGGPAPKAGIDLSGDKTRMFNMAYTNLTLRGLVEYYYINPGPTGVFPALETGSAVSKLSRLMETRHSDVTMDDESRRAVYAWIDANAPYYGTWEMSRPHVQGGRDTWTGTGGRPLPWFATLLDVLRSKGLRYSGIEDYGHGGAGHLDQVKVNLTHPEWSHLLLENLARSSGGLADDGGAAFPSKADPDYCRLLSAIEEGKRCLYAKPRVDMPGGVAIPQARDFGRVF